jgi:phosphoribosylformylglycinamidine synthase
MVKLKVIIDGGKNTLSMATQVGRETLKDPDNLIISTYVTCLNITKTITLDLTIC